MTQYLHKPDEDSLDETARPHTEGAFDPSDPVTYPVDSRGEVDWNAVDELEDEFREEEWVTRSGG